MQRKFFVAGTDTGVGKTLISTALLAAANKRGLTTAAMKPIAAGCRQTAKGLRNDDALALQEVISQPLSYQQINPIALEPAIAPHIALQQAGQTVTVDRLAAYCSAVLTMAADCVVVEGAGGWRVPLNAKETLADLPKVMGLPVILVVAVRLGCINHALLTAEAIQRDGVNISGWVANQITPDMSAYKENIASLKQRLPAPCLGEIPFMTQRMPLAVASCLDVSTIL
jgi:dethiobiotin synthetase